MISAVERMVRAGGGGDAMLGVSGFTGGAAGATASLLGAGTALRVPQ
jgi:hypothetical protein